MSSIATPNDDITSTPKSDQSSTSIEISRARGRGRKGHRKSRQGCFNCKQRKIKCQETLPECANCARLSLRCQYMHTGAALVPQSGSDLQPSMNTIPEFSLTDLRLFQHYLIAAHPHFPVACEDIWLSYITPISHQSGFLMHALLGLSASHLSKISPGSYTDIAQDHRLKASKGLNQALSAPLTTPEEADAIIATCHALLMQSWFMDDGLSAFLVLTRSANLIPQQVRKQNIQALLAKEDLDSGVEFMKGHLSGTPSFSLAFVYDAVSSLNGLLPLCSESYQQELQVCMLENLLSLCHTSVEAYTAHANICKYLVAISHEDFVKLCDTSNTICQLLIAHFIALHIIMRPISCRERKKHTVKMYRIRMTTWIDQIHQKVDDNSRKYIEWPKKVSELNQLGLEPLDSYILS